MKKLYFLFLLFFATNTFANPISAISRISEIYFNESGEWTIELDLTEYYYYNLCDSIKIESNTGIGKIISFDTTYYIIVINKENLDNPISISKEGDYIRIHFYYSDGRTNTDDIAIGNYPESYLHNIENGQSIAMFLGFRYFFKSKPSIGYENDFSDAITGNISGYFYDVNGELIKNRCFSIHNGSPFRIKIDENGFYSTEILAKEYLLTNLSLSHERYINASEWDKYYSIEQTNINMQEDDSINIDFRLTQELSSLKNVDEQTAVLLSNYPNPAKDYTYFIFDERLLNKGCSINIHDINGKLVFSFKPNSSTHYFDCSTLHKGMYIYTLSIDNEIIAKNKLIIAE